jgi:hypothetical protein
VYRFKPDAAREEHMHRYRSTVRSLFVAAGLLVVTSIHGDRAAAVTRIHDIAIDEWKIIYGATNGQGNYRGPWVVQIAVAKDHRLTVRSFTGSPPANMRMIAGNGAVYFYSLPGTKFCITVPVTGWITIVVDVPGASEQTFDFQFMAGPLPCIATPEEPPH